MEAEYLQLPAGSPQSQGMTLTALTTSLATLVLHLSLTTPTGLTLRLSAPPQLEREAGPAGTPGGEGVTLIISRPSEVRRLSLTAALSVPSRIDQELLTRLTETVLSCSPGHHTPLT